MSVHVLSWVLKHSPAQSNDRLCLICLANYADDSGLAWPGLERIAWEMGQVSVRTAQRALRSLEDAERIVTIANGAPDSRIRKDRKPNAYRVLRGDAVVAPWANGLTDQAPRGDRSGTNGVTPVVTQTVIEPSEEKTLLPDGSDAPIFEKDFWPAYPARNGRKVGKAAARTKWSRLSPAHRAEAVAAAAVYASAVARSDTIPRDAERFLANRYWQDWLSPDAPPTVAPSPYAHGERSCTDCDDRRFVLPDGATEVVPCPTCCPTKSA